MVFRLEPFFLGCRTHDWLSGPLRKRRSEGRSPKRVADVAAMTDVAIDLLDGVGVVSMTPDVATLPLQMELEDRGINSGLTLRSGDDMNRYIKTDLSVKA